MIDVKEAVQVAKGRATDLLNQSEMSLEEIERVDYKGRDVWSITLGFHRNLNLLSPLAKLSGNAPTDYKRFLIDVESGEFLAMKLREIVLQ